MQSVEEAGTLKSRSDEESINFRPSPNFKHMKKYLKLNLKENINIVTDGTSTEILGYSVQEVQPPLPPYPPPPDSPTIRNVKKEIEDDQNQCDTTENTLELNQPEQLVTDMNISYQSGAPKEPKLIMCRNFARGTCKRGASCIFIHKIILSQLPGTYTFCRNFQNSVCEYTQCKYVHATVFEKEHYFRSGYLPPHTLSHIKKANVMQPPPPPPLPQVIPTNVTQKFSNVMVPPSQPCIAPVPVLNYAVPSTSMVGTTKRNDSHPFRTEVSPTTSLKRTWSNSDEFSSSPWDLHYKTPPKKGQNCDDTEFSIAPVPVLNYAVPSTSMVGTTKRNDSHPFRTEVSPTTSLKRTWSNSDEFSRSPWDLHYETPPKKCQNCDDTEFRYQYHKNKVEEMRRSCEERQKEIVKITEKSNRLSMVLTALLNKPMAAAGSSSGLNAVPNIGSGNETNLLGSNIMMTNLLAMLLQKNAESTGSPNTQ